jgi:hypothetical protein
LKCAIEEANGIDTRGELSGIEIEIKKKKRGRGGGK